MQSCLCIALLSLLGIMGTTLGCKANGLTLQPCLLNPDYWVADGVFIYIVVVCFRFQGLMKGEGPETHRFCNLFNNKLNTDWAL